jgi:predicted DCC family thiol-disulfide oxidoreductase YuxK
MSEHDARPVIVYDGECPFCRSQMARIRRWSHSDRFEFVARQEPGITDRFPALAEGDFSKGMRVILPDGSIRVGPDAVYAIARRLPHWRWLAPLYRVPVLHALLRWAYAYVARHRDSLTTTCDEDACAR